ncbi:MAG: LPS assembly protein LptD [Porticoccaceae bacterium]|nr:LPS assembly protein LptD [Porticoccaceae bacterium]
MTSLYRQFSGSKLHGNLATAARLRLATIAVALIAVSPPSAADETGDHAWNCQAGGDGEWLCGTQRPTSENAYQPPTAKHRDTNDPDAITVTRSDNLDWVEAVDMSAQQRVDVDANCCGAYLEPQRLYTDSELDPELAPLRFSATKTEAIDNNRAVLEGDVQVSQGYRQVRSDRASIDQSSRKVALEGDVQFREPGMLLLGSRAQIDTSNREVQIEDATYLLHQSSVRGTAKRLTRNRDGLIVIDEATYSTCEPDDNTWQLVTREIAIDQQEGFATVKSARLEVSQVPIFYFPWLTFPIDDRRSSGLLFPTLGANRENGIDFLQPIYWNIAENYDATFAPRYLSERGIALGGEFRHLSQWSKSAVQASWLGSDRGGNDGDPRLRAGSPQYRGEDRYLLAFNHRGGMRRPWSSSINFKQVSDSDYFGDLGNRSSAETSLTHLQRSSDFSYKRGHWTYAISSEDYQVISDDINDQYAVLPRVSVDGYYRFDNHLIVDVNQAITRFEHHDSNRVSGRRYNLSYAIAWDKRVTWGYIKPEVSLVHLGYELQNNSLGGQSPALSTPVMSLDSGLFLERSGSPFGDLTQTLEPRIYYVKSNYKAQSSLPDFDTREYTPSYNLLFRNNRFNGGDRVGDAHRVTLALTSRFIDNRTGEERFKASVAQAIYLDDRRVTLNTSPTIKELRELRRNQSPLAIDLSARIAHDWRLNGEVIYNNHDSDLEKSSFGVRYKDRDQRMFNFTYRYTSRAPRAYANQRVDQDIEQADISGFMPLSGNFNWVGRWNHDFTNSRTLEIFSGFEYNSCCWRASLVVRRAVRRDDDVLYPEQDLQARNSILFQFQFKGLAGSGGRIDSILQEGIYGYETVENF